MKLPVTPKFTVPAAFRPHGGHNSPLSAPQLMQAKLAGSAVKVPPVYQPQQRALMQPKIPPRIRPAAGLIQRSSYGSDKVNEAKNSGARLGGMANQTFDLDTVPRKKFSWFSKRIQTQLGVDPKPKNGDKCRMCGKVAHSFQLDHMTPWRQYVAAWVAPEHVQVNGEISGDVIKALYNDPENLWWVCSSCNSSKTDIIPETSAHANNNFSSGTTGRTASASGAKPSSFY
jgi:hypothetical protein